MLQFQELTAAQGDCLRRYYEACDYRLCEYSLGVKLMWRGHLNPSFAEEAGCLIVRNRIEGEYVFDYPIVGEGGDLEGALCAIEAWCAETGTPLVLSVVPEDKLPLLALRYPRFRVINERPWKDYLYRGAGGLCRTPVQRPAQPHQQIPPGLPGRGVHAPHRPAGSPAGGFLARL